MKVIDSDRKKTKKKTGRVLRFERNSDFLAKRADNKRMQNDPLKAIKLYRAALSNDPENFELRLSLAETLTDINRFIDSNHVLVPYMHKAGDMLADAYYMVGFNFFGVGEYAAARKCFDRFFELSDEVSARSDAVMDALDYIDGLEEEAPLLREATEAVFNEKLNDARAHMVNNEYEKAMELFSDLHEMQPGDNRIQYDLALSCMCCHEYEKGLACIDELLEKNSCDLSAISLKMIYAQTVHDEVMMGGLCNRLEKCDPDLPDELVPILGVILDFGKVELALKLAKRVYHRLPYDRLSNHVLALCYIRQKKYLLASKFYERLLAIDPNDSIAYYFRSKCLGDEPKLSDFKTESMLHYQLPLIGMMENIKQLSALNLDEAEALRSRWQNEREFRVLLRWAFTLHEFGISYAVMNVLRTIGDEDAQLLMRDSIIDPGTNPTLVHETLGMLKMLGAEEPYFAFVNSSLLEGKVSMLNVADIKLPKQYKLIFPRFHKLAAGLYGIEVYAAASGIMESFIASLGDAPPQLDEKRSTALSAALECLACKRCGVDVSSDILERYDVSETRLNNAVDKLIISVFNEMTREEDPE